MTSEKARESGVAEGGTLHMASVRDGILSALGEVTTPGVAELPLADAVPLNGSLNVPWSRSESGTAEGF